MRAGAVTFGIEPVPPSFDPSDRDQVSDAILGALRKHQPLARLAEPPRPVDSASTTRVWFVDLAGVNLPLPWQGPLVLRIFRSGDGTVAEREDRVTTFLASKDFPAPATHLRGELGSPPHPFVLQSRLPGRPAIEMLAGPHGRGIVARVGRLQGELHRMSTNNLRLRRLTASVYVENELATRQAALAGGDDADGWLAWLRRTAPSFEARRESDLVVCHGDLHPRNAVVDVENGLRVGIVDWADSCIADRHLDLGRTVAIYWFASASQRTSYRRTALRVLRSSIVQLHVRSYRSVARVRLDRRRMLWWQIAHLYHSWLLLRSLVEHPAPPPTTAIEAELPATLPTDLLDRCRALRTELERRGIS